VELLDIARELRDTRLICRASNALAQFDRSEGRLDSAERLYLEALSASQGPGERVAKALVLLNLAMLAIDRGDGTQSTDLLGQALSITQETGSRQAMQSAFEVAAGLAASQGDWERSARLHGIAERHMQETEYRRDPTDDKFLSSWIAKARAALGDARFQAAEAGGRSADFATELAATGRWLAARA
jgi:hypothetical protein